MWPKCWKERAWHKSNNGASNIAEIWKDKKRVWYESYRSSSESVWKGERPICRLSKKYHFMTTRQIGKETGILLKASIDSVKRVLRNFGLVRRIAAKKPLLNKKPIEKRMHWCKSYSALSWIDWKNIIFSDESRIERHSLRRRYIRRQIHVHIENR